MAKKKRSRPKKRAQPALQPGPKMPSSRPEPGRKDLKTESTAPRSGHRLPLILGFAAIAVIVLVFALLVLRPSGPLLVGDAPQNVLLITLDTTRADRLGCYGYAKGQTPNLDSLAQNGVRFAKAYAPVPLTLPSHSSIMTGTYPLSHAVRNNGSYALSPEKLTLAKVLAAQGFKTAAFVSSFSLDSRFGLGPGFDIYDDNFGEGSPAERTAGEVNSVFSAWFDKLKDERFFCWVHFFDPHLPYSPPPPYRAEFADRPYDGEIAYVDSVIGEVIAKIKARNLLGRTLVVVAGDHGEAFGEKGEAGHGVFLYEMALKVPLIFYAENRLPAEKVVPARVRLIDIMPTILNILNLPKPESVQGVSLIPYIQGKTKADLDSYIETYYPKENYGWAPLFGMMSRDWKYIRAPKEELYNLKTDPNEANNIFLAEPKKAADLKAGLDTLVKDNLIGGSSGRRTLTAAERDKLRSLGYVDYSDKTAQGEIADPKDKLDELKMVQDAEKFEFEGDFQAAAELHEKMLALRPNVASGYDNLSFDQARMRQFEAAIQTLKQGLEKIPHSEILLSRLGHTYLVSGRMNEALAAMGEILKINPGHIDALTSSAMLLGNMGKREEAGTYFERALAVAPRNKFLLTSYANYLAANEKIPEAIEIYSRLKQDFPRDYKLSQLLGITYGLSQDFDKAIENLKEANSIKATAASYFYLAISFREKGDIAEAVRSLGLYLEDPKGEPEPRIKRARADMERMKKLLNK